MEKPGNRSISFLLGAGFSAPKGYPVGNVLSEKIKNCKGENFAFHTDGRLIKRNGKRPTDHLNNSYDQAFEFFKDLVQVFQKEKGYFDYEEFYDFILEEAKNHPIVKSLHKEKYLSYDRDISQLIYSQTNLYPQIIGEFLKDSDGNSWYDEEPYSLGPEFHYEGILECFSNLGSNHVVNIHTLNHDLFFEGLAHSIFFDAGLDDGFEELGSPYFGKITVGRRIVHARLECYNGHYSKPYRLYKLHGSRDYVVYYESKDGSSRLYPSQYIKIKRGVDLADLLKEVPLNDGLKYDRCFTSYHSDFLTGTTSKIQRYTEPLLYKEIFSRFRENLKNAQKLVIIGYGGADTEINKIIVENFDFKRKPAFVIDPNPGEKLKKLIDSLGAKHLKGTDLNNVKLVDFGIRE